MWYYKNSSVKVRPVNTRRGGYKGKEQEAMAERLVQQPQDPNKKTQQRTTRRSNNEVI
jgi:hypothetical protein